MAIQTEEIFAHYERFYAERGNLRGYPTEFVVRTFLAHYPHLNFTKPSAGDKILDVGFGDGRNAAFLCDLGLDVSGIEITQGIVDQTASRLTRLGHVHDLRVGRNSNIPFDAGAFDYVLACHSCYSCDDGQTLLDNLYEYSRVLKPGGFLVASVPHKESYIFKDCEELPDGSAVIRNDPYSNRNGYRPHAFASRADIEKYFSPMFENFSFGLAENDYYGILERVFWVVCQKG